MSGVRVPEPTNFGRYLNIFADRPIKRASEDRLGFLAYADAFALLINDRATATPLMLAISGPWGAGKTSLARLLEERLSIETYWRLGWDAPPVVCWFNAWLHRDAPQLGAALAASVARDLAGRRTLLRRIVSPLPSAMLLPEQRWLRNVWRGVVIGAAVLLVVILASRFSSPGGKIATGLAGLSDNWTDLMAWWALLPLVIALLRNTFKVSDTLSRFIDEPRSEAARGTLSEVHGQLGRVVRQAQGGTWWGRRSRRIIVMVDDLERCPPEKALDVCEVAAHLLNHTDLATVLVADLDLIESAASQRYAPAAMSESSNNNVGRQYLHKLIQLRFNLPPLADGVVLSAVRTDDSPTDNPEPGRR